MNRLIADLDILKDFLIGLKRKWFQVGLRANLKHLMSKRHESKLPIMIVEFQNIRVFLPQLNSFLFLCSEKYTIFWEFSLQKALKFFYFLQFVSLIGDDELLVRA